MPFLFFNSLFLFFSLRIIMKIYITKRTINKVRRVRLFNKRTFSSFQHIFPFHFTNFLLTLYHFLSFSHAIFYPLYYRPTISTSFAHIITIFVYPQNLHKPVCLNKSEFLKNYKKKLYLFWPHFKYQFYIFHEFIQFQLYKLSNKFQDQR